jgi:hypothetical protein
MLGHILFCAIVGHKKGFIVAFGLDQAANGSLGGDPDETLCSRAWREHRQSKKWDRYRRFFDWLFSPVEDNHCRNVYLRELAAREQWNRKQ